MRIDPRSPATALTLALSLSLALAPATAAADGDKPARPLRPGELTLRTERVVVFKDGYGLLVKRAAGRTDAEGRLFTEEVPDEAVLGSFWAQPLEGGGTLAIEASWHEEKDERTRLEPCSSIPEMLRANVGKRLVLTLARKEDPAVTGALVAVLTPLVPEPPRPGPGEGPRPPPPGESVRPLDRPAEGGHLAVVERAEGDRIAIPLSEVRMVSGPDLVTATARREQVTVRRKRLRFDPALPAKAAGHEVALRIFYFVPGLRWIPTYRLEEQGIGGEARDGTARIALQAEVLNEVEDFEDAALDLVVGVPNFRFRSVVSPLALEAAMRRTLAGASRAYGFGNDLSNALFTQRAGEWRGGHESEPAGAAAAADLDFAPELTGAGVQDHFVYSRERVTLRRGSRAVLPLWETEAPSRHVFTLDVKVVRNAQGGYQCAGSGEPDGTTGGSPGSPLRLSQHRVWHQLELTNRGAVPWTTGAALLMRGRLPLGQELLTYTPPRGRSLLPVTVAPDVRGGYEEEEIGRAPTAPQWDGHSYARVQKRGTVTMTNHRAEPVRARVTLSAGGRAEKASDGGTIRVNDYLPGDWEDQSYARVNNHSDLSWELELAAGATKTLTCEISFFVR